MDVGGATTDVYSVAKGAPTNVSVRFTGLPEPYAKRTVEGDLGLYHNLDTLKGHRRTGEPCRRASKKPWTAMCRHNSVPEGDDQTACHLLLSAVAVRSAVDRHAGIAQDGGHPQRRGDAAAGQGPHAGGLGRRRRRPGLVLGRPAGGAGEARSSSRTFPLLLKPKAPEMLLDEQYVLFALGLLAQSEPAKALRLMREVRGAPAGQAPTTRPEAGDRTAKER